MPEAGWIEIIGDVAHDLKTPIAAAMGFIDLVEHSGELNDRQRYLLQRAFSTLDQMSQLVLRLIEVSWLDADQPLVTQACDLRTVIDKAVATLRGYGEKRKVTLHTDIAPDLGSLQADEQHLDHVLLNLLGNAIKYNRKDGEVWLTAKGMPDSVEVSVRDNGVGIPLEDLPHVFDRFYRGTEQERIEGTGLGLSIVKTVVERHGGHVWVESKLGEGATFTFVLPRIPRMSDGRDGEGEAIIPPVERAESVDFVREGNVNEEIDAVDDNAQEPPQAYVDPDEAGAL